MKKVFGFKNENAKFSTFYKMFNQRGIGLVEVIAALGISVVVITSLLSLTLFSLRSSLQGTVLLEATKAANRQTELLRAYRDLNSWTTFVSSMNSCVSPNPCSMALNSGSVSVASSPLTTVVSGTNVTTFFNATVDGDVIHITVESSWSIGGQPKNTFVYTDFTNWQNK